jgi:hypothetical protein
VVSAALGGHSPLAPVGQSLAKRIKEFSTAACTAGVPIPAGQTLFTITFLSDGILRDDYLRPTTELSAALLSAYVDPRLATAVPLGAFGGSSLVDGWLALHGLPRDTAVAVSAGSVFAFSSPLPPADLAAALAQVETSGLGEWRDEGYGRVIVAHPFHLRHGQD